MTPYTGTGHEMLAGKALGDYSYAYHVLFTGADDEWGTKNYLSVKPGMRLVWFQYNYLQSTIGIDLELVDLATGRRKTLRDSGITDFRGISVHPAWRGGYPEGQWFSNIVYPDGLLEDYVDWKIDKWMIAYDNGNNRKTGQYRAYFDNFRVEYSP